MKKKVFRSALIGNILVFFLIFVVFLNELMTPLRNYMYDKDAQISLSADNRHDIVVVGIDDKSLKEIGAWPWDRKVYIPFIEALEKAGAKVIAFDVMFNEKGDPASDQALAGELAKYKNIIFPYEGVFKGQWNEIDNDSVQSVGKNEARQVRSLNEPLDLFKNVTQAAHINANPDSDGVIRKTFLQLRKPDNQTIKSLAIRSAELAGVNTDDWLKRYPQEMNVHFDMKSEHFDTIPFAEVTKNARSLKDRIVLVGFTAEGFENDNGTTPIETNMKLVYVHANIVNQLLYNEHTSAENRQLTLLLTLLLLLLPLLLAWRLRPTFGAAALIGIIIILVIVQYWLFSGTNGMFVNMADPIVALLLSYLVNISIKTYFETRQRNYITKQFGRYVSPELVKEIATSDQEIKLGGISKELTVMFLDVRGFTPLSEKLQPEEVVGFLNMMFDLITERALQNHGSIDKFIGDAAMILFNAPLDVPHHEYYAVKTAFEIQEGMRKVRQDVLDKYGVSIAVGIGINTGQVVVGNIGSYLRVDYTAIGDNVNTAARIESNTQPNQVLVSEATYERVKDYFELNYVGEKMMKGKSVGIKVWEVLGHIKAPE